MTENRSQTPVAFAIIRIKDHSFAVNENLVVTEPVKLISIKVQHKFVFNPGQTGVELTLRVFYHYADESIENVIAEIHVQNIFDIPEVNRFVDKKGMLALPANLITALVSVSLSHTRALFAKNLAGTLLQGTIMPILNAEEVARMFFPYAFTNNTKAQRPAAIGSVSK